MKAAQYGVVVFENLFMVDSPVFVYVYGTLAQNLNRIIDYPNNS